MGSIAHRRLWYLRTFSLFSAHKSYKYAHGTLICCHSSETRARCTSITSILQLHAQTTCKMLPDQADRVRTGNPQILFHPQIGNDLIGDRCACHGWQDIMSNIGYQHRTQARSWMHRYLTKDEVPTFASRAYGSSVCKETHACIGMGDGLTDAGSFQSYDTPLTT